MTIAVDRLRAPEDFRACEALQADVLGSDKSLVCGIPLLAAVQQSSGLLLGARNAPQETQTLQGALIDLAAQIEGFPAYLTVFRGVVKASRNQGIATQLRMFERAHGRKRRIELIRWEIDPLQSTEAHLALNTLAAIGTAYTRDAYGELHDPANLGLATDRLRIEWWLDSPRVVSVIDRRRAPAHRRLGLHEMDVLTRTRTLPPGIRVLEGFRQTPQGPYVLAEIPVDLDAVRTYDLGAAKAWRTGTRELFELLLGKGYVVVGFIHEGGRSFYLLERANRGRILGRS